MCSRVSESFYMMFGQAGCTCVKTLVIMEFDIVGLCSTRTRATSSQDLRDQCIKLNPLLLRHKLECSLELCTEL